ncbi:MAG TPA: hypothetical protein VFA17_00010 [Thermoplasmata archaeon]|nr:hypothetical protein [Thermoplasmata archaeon]
MDAAGSAGDEELRRLSRMPIIYESDVSASDAGWSFRHPQVAYLFGDMIRGLYVVGCLAADLFVALQVHESLPDLEAILLPLLGVGFVGLAYLELRLYRALWPGSRRRRIVRIVEGRVR